MNIRFLKLLLVAAAIALPGFAHAAGLGKLTVKSALGEPLSGEIELVNVQAEELSTLTVKMASREAFNQARAEYRSVLSSVRFAVEMRPDGNPVIRVTSTQPVNEPFVDMLVELTWASGRLLREYTFLLDPPQVGQPMAAPKPEAQPTAPPVAAPPPTAETVKPAAAPPAPPAPRPTPPAAAKAAETYGPVKYGDSLSKIALRIRPEGVSLDQMLVALYRANPQAFMGNNMNRLKTGPILRIPDAAEIRSLDASGAKVEVKAQASDWRAYKQKLAAAAPAMPAGEEPKQVAEGRVTTRVEEQGEAAKDQPKEVLKLSKGEPAAGAADTRSLESRVRSLQEENTAKEKALNEANERVALLEKNIKEMQKLLEMKGAAPTPGAQAPAPAPAAAPTPAPAPTTAPAAAPAAETKPTVEVAKPEPSKPAPPKPKPAPPPPAPSFFEELMDNPIFLAAGGLAVVLLGAGGYLAYRRRSEAAEVKVEELFAHEPPAAEPAVTAGAEQQRAEAPPSEEVDPLAEAEVYLAYGRDGQAEEILKEALGRDRNRQDVHLKLLEIYSKRKDRKAFEQTARTLQGLGAGGAAWETVQAMGLGIDPENPLYGGEPIAKAAAEAEEMERPKSVDFDLTTGEEATPQPGSVSMEKPAADAAIDFDLGALSGEFPAVPPGVEKVVPPEETSVFDVTAPPSEEKPVPEQQRTWPSKPDTGLPSIDLQLGTESAATPSVAHDAHWQEVATKFDLAKVYKEMGDKDGAKEILQEVMRDGDAKQKEDAKALLASL